MRGESLGAHEHAEPGQEDLDHRAGGEQPDRDEMESAGKLEHGDGPSSGRAFSRHERRRLAEPMVDRRIAESSPHRRFGARYQVSIATATTCGQRPSVPGAPQSQTTRRPADPDSRTTVRAP